MADGASGGLPIVKRLGLVSFGLLLGIGCSLVAGEIYYRVLARNDQAAPECERIPDEVIGFVNPPSQRCRHRTAEFDYAYSFNSDGHADSETRLYQGAPLIMALGDSHTRGVGVGNEDAWPNVLEHILRNEDGRDWQVVNMAVAGYNLGQELQLMDRFLDEYRPVHVVLGFSLATDVYDIRTPQQGGFVYLSRFPRAYYDVEDGRLVTRRSQPAPALRAGRRGSRSWDVGSLATKEFWRGRSKLFLALHRGIVGRYGVRLMRRLGVDVWKGIEPILARKLSPTDAHSWLLVERLLEQFADRLGRRGIGFTLVVIPYLPQVYDDIWEQAFGFDAARYDRFVGEARVEGICGRHGIDRLDLTRAFSEGVKAGGETLHYPVDGHPNRSGHRLMGREVAAHLLLLLRGRTRPVTEARKGE